MAKPFKFRHVNEIAGSFVLLVLVAVIAGVIIAGHAQRWFESVHQVNLQFPPEGSFGLKKGSEVQILGVVVGAVDEIDVQDDGSMSGEISIRGDFIRFVRTDSRAIARKKFAVAGDAYVEITKGVGDPLPDDSVLLCEKDTEITETIEQMVQQVRETTVPAIEQVRLALEEYTKLAADLRDPQGNLQQLLARLNTIAEGLEKGEGPAGRILRDEKLAKELDEITAKISESIAEVQRILADVKQATAQLPAIAEAAGGEAQDVPGLILQTQETLRETEKLVKGVQKHWLLRKYVDQSEPSARVPLSAVGPAGGVR
jgi:phospholipid/cholesterol/gamma-HCH transport system substrate-binding protein